MTAITVGHLEDLRVRVAARQRLAVAVLALLSLVDAVGLLALGHGLTFYFDEWDFVINKRGWSIGTFLIPHNEHLSIVPIAIYKLLFATAGLDDYWVYRVVVTAFHVLCVGLVYVLARRRLGAWVGLVPALAILFLGSAWEDILWPFQIGILGSIAAGLGMFLALERRDDRGDVLACGLLAVAIGCSSVGLPFIVGAAVEPLLDRTFRRLWIAAIPLVLYVCWYVKYAPRALQGGGSVGTNLVDVPPYVADSAAAVFGGLTSLGMDWGRILFALALLVVVRRILGPERLSIRFWSVTATAFAFWGLSAVGRAQLNEPAASRYLYTGGVLVVLAAAELARARAVDVKAGLPIAAALVLAALGNLDGIGSGFTQLRAYSKSVRSSLAAMEIAGPPTAPGFRPDPVHAPNIYAGDYFAAVRAYGSPAESQAALMHEDEVTKENADAVLAGALGVHADPGGRAGSKAPTIDEAHWGTTTSVGGCVEFDPTGAGAALDVTAPPAGLVVTTTESTPENVMFHRFAGGFPAAPFLTLPGPGTSTLELPRHGNAQPWHVRIFAQHELKVCAEGGG